MVGMGYAMMGTAIGRGENAAVDAAAPGHQLPAAGRHAASPGRAAS